MPSSSRYSGPDLGSRAEARAAQHGAALERVASWVGAVCAVHCLVMPLVSALVPLMGVTGSALGGPAEELLGALVVVGGLTSLWLGFRRHHDLRIAGAMALCIVLYLVGHASEPAWYGLGLSILAGLGLSGASFWSARQGHVHSPEHQH